MTHLKLVYDHHPPKAGPLPRIKLTVAEAEQLCRHITASNSIAQLIDDCFTREKLDLRRLTSLLEMQSAESDAIIRLMQM